MKRLWSLVVVCGITQLCAGPTESAIMATMRLSEQPNYSWVATVSDDARTYDIVGKTVRGEFTQVTMPLVNSLRRQVGRSVTDTDVEMIFRGNVACVIQTDDGWKTPSELPNSNLRESDSRRSYPGSSGRSRSGRGSGTAGAPVSGPRGRSDRGYSNLQLGISHPHEELAVIVGSHQNFKIDGDTVSGVLTDLGAQLLLVRDGQESITPLRASGTFKLWLRDGMVVKYQVQLEGTLSVRLSTQSREVTVHQTTETVLKDIGTTRVDVPAEARAKLGR
jgi:hypothetical protein